MMFKNKYLKYKSKYLNHNKYKHNQNQEGGETKLKETQMLLLGHGTQEDALLAILKAGKLVSTANRITPTKDTPANANQIIDELYKDPHYPHSSLRASLNWFDMIAPFTLNSPILDGFNAMIMTLISEQEKKNGKAMTEQEKTLLRKQELAAFPCKVIEGLQNGTFTTENSIIDVYFKGPFYPVGFIFAMNIDDALVKDGYYMFIRPVTTQVTTAAPPPLSVTPLPLSTLVAIDNYDDDAPLPEVPDFSFSGGNPINNILLSLQNGAGVENEVFSDSDRETLMKKLMSAGITAKEYEGKIIRRNNFVSYLRNSGALNTITPIDPCSGSTVMVTPFSIPFDKYLKSVFVSKDSIFAKNEERRKELMSLLPPNVSLLMR